MPEERRTAWKSSVSSSGSTTPRGKNIATGLEQTFTNKLRQGKCKTLEASRDKAKELEKAIIEFRERTGEPLNDRLQATVMLGIVDEETAIAMEAKGTNYSDFKAIKKDFMETRYINKQARKIGMGEQPDKDLNMMGTEGDGDWEGGEGYEGYYENDLNALKGAKGRARAKAKARTTCSATSARATGIWHINAQRLKTARQSTCASSVVGKGTSPETTN